MAQSVVVKPTGCVRSPLVEMKYLFKFIFPFLRSGVEVKRGKKEVQKKVEVVGSKKKYKYYYYLLKLSMMCNSIRLY